MNAALSRLEKHALVVAALGLGGSIAGGFFSAEAFYHAYLVGFLLWIGVPLGAQALLMLHHLAGGGWGFVIRRTAEAATRTFWVLALLFVPVAIGMGSLYEWSHADVVAADPILNHKRAYLNVPFFLARTVVYFLVWMVLAHFLNKWSAEQDRGERAYVNRLQALSAAGLLIYGLTGTFSAIDWAMSLEPHWFSGIYGLLAIVGQMLTALTFLVICLSLLSHHEPLSKEVRPGHFHDLGNLVLAFVLLWAYMALSQYLIIWSANLPEETPWIVRRTGTSWVVLSTLLVIGHFAVPFFLLLQREAKRKAAVLTFIAGLLFFYRLVDLVWLVKPAFSPDGLRLSPLDLTVPVGMGGAWAYFFLRELKKRPLVPLGDPRFFTGVEHGRG